MEKARFFHEEAAEEGTLFSATIIELKNALMALLSEGDESLGTLAVSIPQKLEVSRQPISSMLLGERHVTIARIVAEKLAALTNKIVLVSVFIRTVNEAKAAHIFIRLLDEALKKRGRGV